jgi:hypothetical protein
MNSQLLPAFAPEPLPTFVVRAAKAVQDLGLEKTGGRGPKGAPASERIIRDYITRGLLDQAVSNPATGERGLYGPRHLLQFLAVRVLLNDGWPLSLIGERLHKMEDDKLAAMLPAAAQDNPALSLAMRLRRLERGQDQGADEVPSTFLSKLAALSADPTPAPSFPAVARRTVTVDVGPGIQLIVEQGQTSRIGHREAEAIGRAVTAALLNLKNLIQK